VTAGARAFAVLALLAFAGCGYTLAGRGSFLPSSIHTIGVPTFANHSPVFNLETTLTEKVRSEFIGRGKYQILPQDTGVDAVLIGDISGVSIAPVAFNTQQLASRYTITISASIQLKDLHENKVLWRIPASSSARITTTRAAPMRSTRQRSSASRPMPSTA
jgi:lipopolysaccharide assembly LptE-like protein